MRELKFTQKHSKSKKYAIKKRLVFRKGKKKYRRSSRPNDG